MRDKQKNGREDKGGSKGRKWEAREKKMKEGFYALRKSSREGEVLMKRESVIKSKKTMIDKKKRGKG